MLGARTRLVALLGHPVAHSLSPRMQNAAFEALGLDWAYVALDVEASRFAEAVRGLAAAGFAGANVTAPHKAAAAALCDTLDDDVARAGSVNTLLFRADRIHGASTDTAALDGVEATSAVLIGDGGAATAWRVALETRGIDVTTFARKGSWPPDASGADLVVNATPVLDQLLVEPEARQAVIDLAYHDDVPETALVVAARRRGCRQVVDGREVLVRQGAASFELWTGSEAPLDVMRTAVHAHGVGPAPVQAPQP